MKKSIRILALLCVACLLCCACGKQPEEALATLPERTVAPVSEANRSVISDYTGERVPLYIASVTPDAAGVYLIVTAYFVETMSFSEKQYAAIEHNGFVDLRWVDGDFNRYYVTYGPDGTMYLDTDGAKQPWTEEDTILSDYALLQVYGEDGVYKVRQRQTSIVQSKRLGDEMIIRVPLELLVYDSDTAHIASVYESYGQEYVARLLIPAGTAQELYQAYSTCLCGGVSCKKSGVHYTYITMTDGIASYVEYEVVYGDHAFLFL